ncbi:AAA family ATPase [Zooshikella sp. RANM57]|uniref:AAA family ATPase n=1 Tax=Zooshikella sp. RANM57 TaxID=3425863 RepID=UPI003D6E771E
MKLVELKIHPSGKDGWSSKDLVFASDITQLYGPNGAGKTPVIHSIAFALGYPVRYRDDIMEKCSSARLTVEHEKDFFTFERSFSDKFHIEVSERGSNETRIFYNEQEISEYLFLRLGLSPLALTTNNNEPTYPYISTFLPLFYIDQDAGYTSAYKAPSSFIKDQYAEMIRLGIGTAPKHSFEAKRFLIEKKRELDLVNIQIVNTEGFIRRLEEQSDVDNISVAEIDDELEQLKDELEELRNSFDATNDADYVLQRLIREKQNERLNLSASIKDLESRISGFNKIKGEIEIEINTLSLNEESRRLFSSFKDICVTPGCGLFTSSSDSYGKNLLYLRDQIKDLDRNTRFQEIRVDEYTSNLRKLDEEIASLESSLTKEEEDSQTTSLIAAISALTRSIIDRQGKKEVMERIESEKQNYVQLLNNRRGLQGDISSFEGGTSSNDIRILEFRNSYRKKIIEWLDVLSTKNVSRDITVDSDFNVLFGAEKLSQFSGSTLLRTVLALRAAFFELFISTGCISIEFLIFDTPRQHDIETKDFAAFIARLKSICKDNRAQIVFSTTEYHYNGVEGDIEWKPEFSGFEQPMYLGVIDNNQVPSQVE